MDKFAFNLGDILQKLNPTQDYNFDDTMSPRDILNYHKRRHRANPDFKGNVNVLSRSRIPVSQLSESDLRDMGYMDSMVAVPEIGQSRWNTFRHPRNKFHFHRHNDDWIFHEDSWPSLSMVIERLRQDGDKTPIRTALSDPGILAEAIKHGLVEGIPGYTNWLYGNIIGRPGFSDVIKANSLGKYLYRTGVDAPARSIAATSLASVPGLVLGSPALAGLGAGGVAGFTAGAALGNRLAGASNGGIDPGSLEWALRRSIYGGAIPILGAVSGGVLGQKLANRLFAKSKEKQDKDSEINNG